MPVSNDLPDQCPLRRQQSMHNTNSVDLSGLKVGMAFAIHFDSLTNAPHGFGVFMGADRGFFLPHVTFINEITTQDNVRFSKSPVSNFAHEDARKRCFLHHLNDQDWKKLMKNLPPLIVSMCGGMRSLIPNCSACNQGFTNAEELACHKCLCPHCAQPFRRKPDFLAHVAKCAQPIPNCSACNQGFTNAEELACHKCVCPKCAQPFRRKPDFLAHIAKCAQPIPNCSACNQPFHDEVEKRNHRCVCRHCSASFKRKPDYLNHIEICGSAEAIFMRREQERLKPQDLPLRSVEDYPHTAEEVLQALRTWSIGQLFKMTFITTGENEAEEVHGLLLRWDMEMPILSYAGEEEDVIKGISDGKFSVLGLRPVIKHKRTPDDELKAAKKKIKVLQKENDDLRKALIAAEHSLRAVGCHEMADALDFSESD